MAGILGNQYDTDSDEEDNGSDNNGNQGGDNVPNKGADIDDSSNKHHDKIQDSIDMNDLPAHTIESAAPSQPVNVDVGDISTNQSGDSPPLEDTVLESCYDSSEVALNASESTEKLPANIPVQDNTSNESPANIQDRDQTTNESSANMQDQTVNESSSNMPDQTANESPANMPDQTSNESSANLPDQTANESSANMPDQTANESSVSHHREDHVTSVNNIEEEEEMSVLSPDQSLNYQHNNSMNNVAKFKTESKAIPAECIAITEFMQTDDGSDVDDTHQKQEVNDIDLKVNDFLAEINSLTTDEVEDSVTSAQEADVVKDEEKEEEEEEDLVVEQLLDLIVDLDKPDSDDSTDDIQVTMKKPMEPKSAWKQVFDDDLKRYYFWNNLTNAVQWIQPEEYSDYLEKFTEYKLAKRDFKDHRKQITILLEERKIRREERRRKKIQIKFNHRKKQLKQLKQDEEQRSTATTAATTAATAVEGVGENCVPVESSPMVGPMLPDHLDTAADDHHHQSYPTARGHQPPTEVTADQVTAIVDYKGGDSDTYDDIDELLQMHLENKKKELQILNTPVNEEHATELTLDSTGSRSKTTYQSGSQQMSVLFSDCDFDHELKILNKVKKISSIINDKLNFFELDPKEISNIKILQIQLKTRFEDWRKGELKNSYLLKCLDCAVESIATFEAEITPNNWKLHWNRENRRYFYKNKKSGEVTWNYPEEEEAPKDVHINDKDSKRDDDELYDYAMRELDQDTATVEVTAADDVTTADDDVTTIDVATDDMNVHSKETDDSHPTTEVSPEKTDDVSACTPVKEPIEDGEIEDSLSNDDNTKEDMQEETMKKTVSVISAKPQSYTISSPPGPPDSHKSERSKKEKSHKRTHSRSKSRSKSRSPKKSSKKSKKKHKHREGHGKRHFSSKKNLSSMVEKWQKVAEDI